MHRRGHRLALKCSRRQLFCVSVHHDHMPSLRAEYIRCGKSNAARRAGNECSFHIILLLPDCAAGSQQRQVLKMFQAPSEAVM